jgi:hypothetical protein
MVAPSAAPRYKASISLFGPIFLFVIGCGLIAQGCWVELVAKNSMNQIYAAINYCSGFILLGAALFLDGLRSLCRNQ